MKKKVLLLAVSCKTGGLCPGGIDLSNPKNWIRIVKDDGSAGAVQGCDIDFGKPLDIIEFDGCPMPQGKQKENWIINDNSCVNHGRGNINGYDSSNSLLEWAYSNYGYHGFWNNYKAYLNEEEFENVNQPSESILRVSEVKIYKNNFNRAKIDFQWSGARYKLTGISMTDQNYYDQINNNKIINFDNAYVVISIPKQIDDWIDPTSGEKRAYKFVSKIFEIL